MFGSLCASQLEISSHDDAVDVTWDQSLRMGFSKFLEKLRTRLTKDREPVQPGLQGTDNTQIHLRSDSSGSRFVKNGKFLIFLYVNPTMTLCKISCLLFALRVLDVGDCACMCLCGNFKSTQNLTPNKHGKSSVTCRVTLMPSVQNPAGMLEHFPLPFSYTQTCFTRIY